MAAEYRAAHRLWGCPDPLSRGAQGWLGECETFWEKREDKGQDAEG